MPQRQRLTVYFSGSVQGVGFRYQTFHLAKNYDVDGYVRNLDDGRVELVAEGRESELEAFLQAIHQSRLGHYISGQEKRLEAAQGLPSGFVIED